MSDPRTDHGRWRNGSAPVRRPDHSPVRARSPSPSRAAALDNEVACPYLRALIKRQTRELSCCGVLFCPLRPYFFFFFASAARSAAGVARAAERSTKAQGASVSSAPRSLRTAANAIDATSRLLDISPVADNAGRGSSGELESRAGRSRTGRGGARRRIMRRVGAAARDEGVVAGRGGRAARARAGRPAGGASSSSSATCRSGGGERCVPASTGGILVASLSYRRRCAPGIDHGRIAFFVAFWERRGSGVPCLLDGDASPVASRAGSTARRTDRPCCARGAPHAPLPGPARQGAEAAAAGARAAIWDGGFAAKKKTANGDVRDYWATGGPAARPPSRGRRWPGGPSPRPATRPPPSRGRRRRDGPSPRPATTPRSSSRRAGSAARAAQSSS